MLLRDGCLKKGDSNKLEAAHTILLPSLQRMTRLNHQHKNELNASNIIPETAGYRHNWLQQT
jgi:hypothetical protein